MRGKRRARGQKTVGEGIQRGGERGKTAGVKYILQKNLVVSEKSINFAVQKSPRGLDAVKQGSMSEWLGTGLQNRLHQFESGWNLKKVSNPRDC